MCAAVTGRCLASITRLLRSDPTEDVRAFELASWFSAGKLGGSGSPAALLLEDVRIVRIPGRLQKVSPTAIDAGLYDSANHGQNVKLF